MRTILPVCGGGDGGESRGLRSKVGRMKKLLWLKPSHCVDVHMHTESSVWLTSFQLLDTDGQNEDPVQEWGEEEEDGAVFGITLRREPTRQNSEAADLPAMFSFVQYHTVKVRRLKAGTLERLVTHLLTSEPQEPDFTRTFLSTYRAFTSTSTLIELLFQRDDSTVNLDNTVCIRSTLPPVIRLWLEEYSEDFHEPPQYQDLRLLCAHLRRRLCFRRLAHTAEALLKRLQEQDCSQSALVNHSESLQQEHSDLEDRGETSSRDEDTHNFMLFPVREVAEQLTRLDADLFVRVVPFDCLGCVWSQRDKKENRNIAPTVRATISQFNAVTNRVITSLLCPSSPSPSTSSPASSPGSSSPLLYRSPRTPRSPHCPRTSPTFRAHIIERWIAIAQECRQLKNFSSLRAILSALQSNAVYRLKKTWAAVCRESMATFDHLCETFLDENCAFTSKEDLMEDGSQSDGSAAPGSKSTQLCSVSRQTNFSSGVVPYLGTYLTVLTMLDTALSDTVDGGLINFEKRRREFEILSQIRQFQASCSHYKLPVNTHITTWLQAHTLLTDQESYELSRDLEPPVDPCPSSPNLWSNRLLTKKLASLRTASDCPRRKTHADQISVSSSGSSSSDMEDLPAPQSSPLRLKLKSFSGSLHNVAEDFSCSPMSSSPSLSSSSCSSSQPDLSSSSLVLNHESSSSSCCSPPLLPVYNKQVADSCIIRVSVECVINGNVYKSILLTSQDHTPQVIQRALEKHNMEGVSCRDFSLCQMLNNGKELQIPDNANVYYAMSTSANYDFMLRPRWRRHLGSLSSPGAPRRNRHAK